MRAVLSLLWALTLGAVAGSSATGQTLSVDDAVRRTLDRDPGLRAARAEALSAEAALSEERAARLPTVHTLASYTRLVGNIPEVDFSFPGFDTTFTILPVELTRYHTEVALEQPLFTGGRVQNRIRAAAARADAASERLQQAEADAALATRTAYWELVRALAVREAVETSVEAVEAHASVVRARFGERAALRRDVLAAQTRISEVELERVEAENAVRRARLELNRLIGLPLDSEVQIHTSDQESGLEESTASLRSEAIEHHPRLRALEQEVEALRLQARATRGAWLPSLSAGGRYLYSRPNPYFFTEQGSFRGTGEVGLTVRWDLFDGGLRTARSRQADAALEAARAQLVDAEERLAVEIEMRVLEMERAKAAVAVAERHQVEARETYRVISEQFAEEAALSADLLDAERNQRAANARMSRAKADVAIARAALLHAIGRVW